ncbi:MAG: hypothetical protein U0263_38510 [Polyangiaceae bacterium]
MLTRIPFGLLAAGLLFGCGGSDGSSSGPAANLLGVTLAGSYDTFPHQDGYQGQTAKNVSAGVRSMKLTDATGAEWTLFDASPQNVSVSYTGPATLVASIAPADVHPGHYTKARLVQDWSRFDVDATLHEPGMDVAGTLHALQATSEGAMVNGATLEQGHYDQTFDAPNVERPYTGTAPIPDHSATAEAEAFDENGEWAVYFPLDLEVPAGATGTLAIQVNLDRAFRWSDLGSPSFAAGTYDIAPPIYEPVEQFGGNRFDVSLK